MAENIVPETQAARNPWVVSTPIALQITADDIEKRRADLYAWSIETGRLLPMPAEWIVALELRGYIVDLITGECLAPFGGAK